MNSAHSDSASRRQTALVVLLPALVVLAGYVPFVRLRATQDLDRASRELAAAVASRPDPTTVASVRERRERLIESVDAERARVTERERAAAQRAAIPTLPPLPRARITEILLRHGLLMIEESASDETRGDDAVPMIASRRLRIVGDYAAMVRALDEIARAGSSSLVLEVGMTTAAEEGGDPTWTLILG